MIPSPAESARAQGRSTLRLLVLCTLLAAPVIIGLLSMHTLSMHGSPAALPAHTALHSTLSAHTAPSTQKPLPGQKHLPGHTALASQSSAPTDSAAGETGVSSHRSPTSATVDPMDAEGGMDGMGMAMTCVLALLVLGLAIALPGLRPQWLHSSQRPSLFAPMRSAGTAAPRPPSLVALCISRT